MAYTLRYYKTLPQPGDRDIVLEIYEKDGVRSSMEIGPVIQALHLDIQGSQEDIDTPVVKTSLVMTFVDAQDHEEASSKKCGNWEEFYTSDSTYWKVLLFVKDSDVQEARQIWGGYVTPDSFTEQLRYRGSVTIVARDNIGHMQDFPFDSKGNEDGMITVYDLVNTAWAKIESPMSLNWRGEEDEAMWLQCDGHDVTGAYLNVSAFKGMNWYEAMEKVLYSIGAVMRYVGDNTVQVSSLRYMPYQGSASMSSLAEIEPKFIAHANRELVPAVRRIEESVKYDISEVLLPLVEPSDFRGDVINGNVWPLINTESGNGWCNVMPSTALYFNPNGYAIEEYPYRPAFEMAQEQIYDSMFLLCNTEGLAEYSQVFAPREVTLEVGLGGNIWLKDGKIINTASTVIRVRYAIKAVYNGIDYFLDEDGSWTESYVEYTATRDGESSLRIKSISHSIPLQAFDAPVVLHFYILELFDLNAEGKNIYVQVQSLKVIPNDNDSLLQTNNVNTIYNNDNNVIISRDPTIGPAYDFVYYGIIKNGMFIKSGDVYLPAKAWAWSGGTPQQMAVYNHLQLLCYHAKPNNVITGDIVNADLGNLRALYMWHGSEHLLQGGSLNFLNGRIEGAILREFARYDDMWGDVTGDSMPATEQESSTNVEEGGSSSGSSATYENTTNVTIGGSGGGSVTVDTFLSDTSTNPVQNRAIKAYVDTKIAPFEDMFYFADENTIGTKYNFFSEQENSAGGVGEAIGTSGGSGDVDLTGYATEEWVQSQGYASASDIPTKVSDLENDENYVTKDRADGTYVIYTDEFVPLVERVEALEESAGNSNVDLTGYATEEWVQDQGYALDSDLSAVKDRVTALEATGGGTGGEIDLSAYATKTWVTEQGYATTSAIPTKVSQLTNDSNYITTTAADGKYAAYSDLKDYLKTTDIADWAKAASKPSYTYDEISGTPDLSIYALATDLANYLTTATASDTYVSKTSLTNTLASYLLKTDIADWAKASTKPTYKYSEIEERPDLSIYALASALADYALKTDVYTKTEVANLLKSYVSQTAFTQYQSEADERMTAVETNVSNNASEITALKTRVGSAESAINDNATNIRNNVGEIAALKTRMTTAEGNIKTNADGITELDKRVDTFEEWYNKVGQYFKYDETNEAWYVAGTFYATGENSAGGAGEELVDIASLDTRVGTLETKVNNLQFSINNLAIDFTALDALISLSGSIQSTEMDALGLTSDAVEGLLNAQYNKVIHSGTYRQVWNYSAYESSDVISIYFHQGDGFDVKSGYELSYNKSTGYWNILFGEI